MSYAPLGESISDIRTEQSLLDGTVIAGAAYGVHLTLFVQCFQLLFSQSFQKPTGPNQNRQSPQWFLLSYIVLLFSLGTIGFGGQIKFNEMTFIQDRNFPGGPLGFNSAMYNEPVNIMTTAAFIVLNWFADALVLFRLFVIWDSNYWIVAFPVLMLAGSFTSSILLLVQLTLPGSSIYTHVSISLGVPYWSISVSINVLATLLITGRLLYLRYRVRQALVPRGSPEQQARLSLKAMGYAGMYTGPMAMLIESASLYAGVGLFYIIVYARGSMLQNVLLPVLGHVQAISPLLIILRVAQGRAWTRRTGHHLQTTIQTGTHVSFGTATNTHPFEVNGSALTGTATSTAADTEKDFQASLEPPQLRFQDPEAVCVKGSSGSMDEFTVSVTDRTSTRRGSTSNL